MSLETRLVSLAQAVGLDIKTLTNNIGLLSNLSTTAKTNVVAAINEIYAKDGDLTTLTTAAKSTLVAAINELQAEIGTLTSLTTAEKTSLVGAINELKTTVDSLAAGAAGVYNNTTPVPTTLGGIAAGSTFTDQTWQEMFDALLYPYQAPSFSSFSYAGYSSPLEMGASTPANPTFSWATTNSGNISTNTIVIQYPIGTNIASGLANDGSESVTLAALTRLTADGAGTRSFRILGTNSQAGSFQRDLSVEWRWRRFSGNSASAGPLLATDIQALSTSSLVTDDAATYSFGAAAGTYKYIACPTVFGTLTTFKDQSTNLDVPFEAPYTVSVTNAFGQTTDYRVYRTTNQLGAAINIVAS